MIPREETIPVGGRIVTVTAFDCAKEFRNITGEERSCAAKTTVGQEQTRLPACYFVPVISRVTLSIHGYIARNV